jgi:hypothetical protein
MKQTLGKETFYPSCWVFAVAFVRLSVISDQQWQNGVMMM